MTHPIVSCRAGFTCPKTQSKLFSGERTSPLRTKQQHYPRFDTPQPNASKLFLINIYNKLCDKSAVYLWHTAKKRNEKVCKQNNR